MRLYHHLALLPALLLAGAAFAADYEPPVMIDEAPEYVPVEVGSGWYLRGDIGAALNHSFEHSDSADGFRKDTTLLLGSVGMGYHVNDFLRGELNAGILPTSKFTDHYTSLCAGDETVTVTDDSTGSILSQTSGLGFDGCDTVDRGSNEAYSLMANAYVDLGTYVGITPFIGGGLGAVYTKYRYLDEDQDCEDSSTTSSGGGETTTVDFDCFEDEFYDGERASEGRYNFAYSLGGGLSYRVTQNASLDLGYEYLAVPAAEYVTSDGDGGLEVEEGIDFHQVKLGFRYDLW